MASVFIALTPVKELNDKIIEHKNNNILLVEPVPYNYSVLKKKFSDSKNIHICTNAVFSKNQKKKFYLKNTKHINLYFTRYHYFMKKTYLVTTTLQS